MIKTPLPLLLCSIGALGIFSACHSENHQAHHQPSFQVTSPLLTDTFITKEYVAQIHSIQHIELMAQERGYLENVYVDEGQLVKQGQMIFKIMPNLYKAEYQKTQAEAELAKIEFLTTKALADSNVVSPNELAMAKARYDRAKAEVSIAKTHLDFTEIRAPFDGIVDRFRVRPGSLIEEGHVLSNLSDNSEMWVYFNLPEAEYLDYMAKAKDDTKMQVQLKMANNQLFKYFGLVKAIEADFNNETGNIAFRANFPNPDRLLRHGETGNVLVTQPLKNVLLLPQKATFEILDKIYVFVLSEGNMLQKREITIAAEMPHLYAVKSGLKETDKVLLEGLRLVRENDEISADYVEPKKALLELHLYAE
jgi:membrane fusion protein (multidrug efflux system)